MGFKRNIGWAALGIVLLLGPESAIAAPPEPPTMTALPDPDAGFVPWDEQHADETAGLDEAMSGFGRAIVQATLDQQRAIAAQCRSAVPAEGAGRAAWEVNCRYVRR